VAAIAEELAAHLPSGYPRALDILRDILGPENPNETGTFSEFYWLMPVARFVEVYGLAHPQSSLDALEEITRRHTGEYAVRPYIEQHYELTLERLHDWARSSSSHVRRLASEGTRTRLPWARRLQRFMLDPEPVLALLEPLRADPSAYVRKSVHNNLHDIAEDHPQRVLKLCACWEQGAGKETC
jgi:3-methyladenine DNA glycosylase AlkC